MLITSFVLIIVKVHIEENQELIILKENVLNVEQHLKSINTTKDKSVIVANVKQIKKLGKEDTYNMEVEEYHNFIANGIVVHNSIDAQRYLLAEWVDQGKCPQV